MDPDGALVALLEATDLLTLADVQMALRAPSAA